MHWLTWRQAWHQALYGPAGFYTRALPAGHFRTSVHTGEAFASAVLRLLRRHRLGAVVDVGAGAGELLTRLHRLDPELSLTAVDLRARPPSLPADISWRTDLPAHVDGLLLGHELLDNIPCDVVEVDPAGQVRLVEVDSRTGQERLGALAPVDVRRWLDRWWPVDEPGQRADVGLARDDWWASACERLGRGLAVAVDYGHLRTERPWGGSVASYRTGRRTPVTLDGRHDVTAHVAVDALAARVGGTLRRQREVLGDLGLSGSRPSLAGADTDPAGYLRSLTASGEQAELLAVGGFGDFWWVSVRRR